MHKTNKKPERYRQAWKALADPFNIDVATREASIYSDLQIYGTQKASA